MVLLSGDWGGVLGRGWYTSGCGVGVEGLRRGGREGVQGRVIGCWVGGGR